ncbi:DNA polymerase IV [Gemella sp. GH3]|uniref:DNA polymerase IV n=1 Tax=unclassified Gemella TaxID=2624949 RepID=UPI0015CFD9C1|nr:MULTISPECIES: DNA polymerase IV [unclassified Gemella]MBF0713458.1 DNA polymerase IV [Gemella sp. GH3.1]NYS50410.1 DNA polymerase IV [Gemella sp. GH3]
MSRVIAHIDMNCFYASVEEKYDTKLKDKPIAIAGSIKDRHGIIVTSNYIARSYGIKTTMRVGEAKKLCPTLKLMKPNFERYQEESKKVFDLIKTYTPHVEVVSIDEAYIDLTDINEPIKTMALIQRRIYKELKLPSSVGISYNKFFSKMASNLKKPKGFTIINKKNYKDILWNMDISKMHGCGKASSAKLKKYGIKTIGDIAQANEIILNSLLGVQGLRLKQKANGEDNRKLKYTMERKSIGNSKTYPTDLEEIDDILVEIRKLSKKVSTRAQNRDYLGNNISIIIKYNDFKTVTKAKKVLKYVNSEQEIYMYASELLLDVYDIEKKIRLLGVSLNDVEKIENIFEQLDIFSANNSEEVLKLNKTMKAINDKYGKDTIVELKKKSNKKNIITTSFSKDFLDE